MPTADFVCERYGSDLYLRKATVEYLGSARYDETLAVYARVGKLGRSSMTFYFEIHRDGSQSAAAPAATPLVSAELVYVNADPSTMKPAPLPDAVRGRVLGYERIAPASSAPQA